jgi:hypothetical protein
MILGRMVRRVLLIVGRPRTPRRLGTLYHAGIVFGQ